MATADGPDGSVDLPQFDRDEHFHDYGTLGEDWYWQGDGNDEERAQYECDLLGLPSFDHEHGYVPRLRGCRCSFSLRRGTPKSTIRTWKT